MAKRGATAGQKTNPEQRALSENWLWLTSREALYYSSFPAIVICWLKGCMGGGMNELKNDLCIATHSSLSRKRLKEFYMIVCLKHWPFWSTHSHVCIKEANGGSSALLHFVWEKVSLCSGPQWAIVCRTCSSSFPLSSVSSTSLLLWFSLRSLFSHSTLFPCFLPCTINFAGIYFKDICLSHWNVHEGGGPCRSP